MSDFLNNLIASAQSPGEAIQPRLGPLYGSSPMNFFPATGEPALDFEMESGDPVLHEPLFREAMPARADAHVLTDAPAPAQNTALVETVNQSQRHAILMRAEMDSHTSVEATSLPVTVLQDAANMPQSLVDPVLQTHAASDRQDKQPALSPGNSDVKAAPFSTRSKTATPGQEGRRSRPMRASNIFSKGEKSMPATSMGSGAITRDQTQASSPDFHSIENSEYVTLPEAGIVTSPLHFSTGASRFVPPSQRELGPVMSPQNIHTSPPAPTIRVNIGRIEVRAITSPAVVISPPTRKRANPPMSLDEYLKQRNGGER